MGVYTFNDGTTDITVELDDWDNKIVSGDKNSDKYWNSKWNFAPEVKEAITLSSYQLDLLPETQTVTVKPDLRQGDLFNGWPEDGEPITVTVNTEIHK